VKEDISLYKTTKDILENLINKKEEEIQEAIYVQRQYKEELIKLEKDFLKENKKN